METGGDTTDDAALRMRAEEEMIRLIEAAGNLRSDLEHHEAVCRTILEGIRIGDPLGPVLEATGSSTWRPRLTESLGLYERLRHRARLRLIAVGLAEGMTSSDIQYYWAITRQLASRAVREVAELD
jgi:hypothetical protein